MSLYDDDEDFATVNDKKTGDKKENKEMAGWATGIKLLQNHMQLKKAGMTLPKREQVRKQVSLAPVINLNKKPPQANTPQSSSSTLGDVTTTTTTLKKSKLSSLVSKEGGDEEEESNSKGSFIQIEPTPFTLPSLSTLSTPTVSIVKKRGHKRQVPSILSSVYLSIDPEWQIPDEYDPLYPNEYDKAVKEQRERRDREIEEDESKRRAQEDIDGVKMEEVGREVEERSPNYPPKSESRGGVSIAPPPSLISSSSGSYESSKGRSSREKKKDKMITEGGNFGLVSGSGAPPAPPTSSGSSAAARIMAKYGYKEGQGLGRKEQGMSTALMVEKTSHKTARIIHENDLFYKFQKDAQSSVVVSGKSSLLPAYVDDTEEIMEYGNVAERKDDEINNPLIQAGGPEAPPAAEGPSLSELLRNPSKVVLLKNMVAPGEVDDDLEPEVKDECNTKYGPVLNVTIYEMPPELIKNNENAIRIYVEFQRVESAVKALVDLNGRFFGGRQVSASFYNYDKYNNLELTD